MNTKITLTSEWGEGKQCPSGGAAGVSGVSAAIATCQATLLPATYLSTCLAGSMCLAGSNPQEWGPNPIAVEFFVSKRPNDCCTAFTRTCLMLNDLASRGCISVQCMILFIYK